MSTKDELMQEIASRVGYAIDLSDIFKNYSITREKQYRRTNLKIRIEQFITAKRIDGLSEKTLSNYRQQLEMFAKQTRKAVNQISTDDIREYIVYLAKDRNIKQSSVDTYIAYLKSFFAWLTVEEIIKRDPTMKIKSGKFDKRSSRKSLKIEEQEKIREACKDKREKSLIEFLISSGCRLSEIVNITISDINFEEKSGIVTGKGNKKRKIYFSTRCNMYLQEYIQERKGDNKALFLSKKRPYENLDKRSIQKIIRDIGNRINLKNLHPHIFRHTFATNCLNMGMDIVTIQRLLGHSNLQTTQIYAQLSDENIKNEYRRFIS